MDYQLKLLGDIFLEGFVFFVIGGSVFAFFVGLVAFFNPQGLLIANEKMSRWISGRRAMKSLEIPRIAEPFFYKYRKIIAPFLIIGALYTLYGIVFKYNAARAAQLFSPPYDPGVVAWLLQNAVIILVGGSLVALVLAGFMLLRPLQLGKIEEWANKSISTRTALKGLDAVYYQPDKFVAAKPRLAAILIILGSLYAMLNFGFFLL